MNDTQKLLNGINKCFEKIREIENIKMDKAKEKQEVFDASIISWCQTGQAYLESLKLI
jgi:hypothetical protein